MEILIIMAAVSLITVCGIIAYLAIKSSAPSADFARTLAQLPKTGRRRKAASATAAFPDFPT